MASESESGTIREQRQGSMGSDERALEERRKIQKLIRDDDELIIPDLFKKLDDYLVKPTNAGLPAAEMIAIGLGKLSAIGDTETHPSAALLKEWGRDKGTVEDLLILVLVKGKNRMQCAASDALGQIGTLTSKAAFEAAAGVGGNVGDKNAAVRARAKIGLRRVNMRLGGRDLGGTRTLKKLDAVELDKIIHQACDGEPELELDHPKDKLYRVTVTLTGDRAETLEEKQENARSQTVFIQIDNRHSRSFGRGVTIHSDYVVLFTPCGPLNDSAYKQVLQMNALRLNTKKLEDQPFGFTQGSLGIYGDEFVMLDTQPIETITKDTIYRAIRVLASLGDEIEKKLTGGKDAR